MFSPVIKNVCAAAVCVVLLGACSRMTVAKSSANAQSSSSQCANRSGADQGVAARFQPIYVDPADPIQVRSIDDRNAYFLQETSRPYRLTGAALSFPAQPGTDSHFIGRVVACR